MVQRKVAKANNKLGIQANSLKTEKNQAITKPSLQNHDGKSKGADLKAIKMKKSRFIKKSSVEISLHSSSKIHEAPQQPGKPPPVVTPTKTPSPKKPSPHKSPYSSPNYMKSTSSSEARKESTSKVSNITSTSKLHKVAKTYTKTSSLKKMRTLTKTPSFKHTRSTSCKKVILCQRNLDVKRATCSSTLKASKFPSYLELKPGATEAEGNSIFKVCPYTYCSLNGHHHISAPPLKRFLSSRRRLMKTLKVRPEVISPSKAMKTSEYFEDKEGNQNEDFFVEVYVPEREVATQVSESLSDGLCSEIDLKDELDQTEETNLSGVKFSLEDEDYPPTPLQKQTSVSSFSVCFGENSDMEWEEGKSPATHDDTREIYVPTDYSHNDDKLGFEFLAEEYPPQFHDEIVECLCFSDTDSWPDSESTQTGEKHTEELVIVTDGMNSKSNEISEYSYQAIEATVPAAKIENESMDEQGRTFSDPFKGIPEAQIEEFDSFQDLVETDGDESNEENYIGVIREEDSADFNMEETEPSDDVETSSTKEEACMTSYDDKAETDQSSDDGNLFPKKVVAELKEKEADNNVSRRSANSEEENDSSKVELQSYEYNVVEVNTLEVQDHLKTEEVDASPAMRNKMQEAIKHNFNKGEPDSKQELLDSSSKLKRSLKCRKADENIEEEREFNPRGPNFLAIEPDPEAEKVDLRHQEIDERRNAEDWMLDYALQKTVNQLAPARKRKVALLVEAFESVLPTPKSESHMWRNSPGFAHARPIQACS